MKKFFKVFINTILICTTIFCSFKVFEKIYDYKKADKVYETIRETFNSNNNCNSSPNINANKHDKLRSANNDYRFWIKVDNTNIDYPVVQYNDNNYYLNHDFNKSHSSSGSIFLDYRNNFENDKSIIIYGHHMKNKTMFGELTKFTQESFFNKNNKFKIEYEDKIYTYEIFSVYIENASNALLKVHFDSDNDYKDYLNYIESKSLFKNNIDISTDDSIVTLYTCSYEFKDARTIVNGRLTSISTNTLK